MENAEQNNPAGRLYTLVSRVIEESRTRGDIAASHLWAAVFEIPAKQGVALSGEGLYEVISRLLQLHRLIDEAEESLRNIEGLHERYFRPFPRIRALPEQSFVSLASNIKGTLREITEGDMTVLEFCSERLGQQHEELIIDEAELKQILENVTSLFNEVQQADLDPDLKTFILDGLESIRRGIYEFRIRGPKRLKETVGEIVGSLYVNYKTVQAAGEDESLEKFNKLFNRLSAMVTFASTGMKLLTAFATPLLPG